MKTLLLGGVAAFAVSSFAWADTPPTVKMTDQQLDRVVGGWCSQFIPSLFTSGGPTNILFEGLPVYEVPEGNGSIHCALKPNGGIPIVIFTGHLGGGQVIVIGDQGAAR
jgi:hypothetical protein